MICETGIAKAHVLPLYYWPSTILSEPTLPIEEDVDTVHEIVHAMIKTMRHHKGMGLAAPQVGLSHQIFVTESLLGYPLAFVNPTRMVLDDRATFSQHEGCLSIPGVFQKNKRPSACEITFSDVDGLERVYTATDLDAFVIQHEYDHLMGRLFIDDWSKLKLDRVKKKVDKALRC